MINSAESWVRFFDKIRIFIQNSVAESVRTLEKNKNPTISLLVD